MTVFTDRWDRDIPAKPVLSSLVEGLRGAGGDNLGPLYPQTFAQGCLGNVETPRWGGRSLLSRRRGGACALKTTKGKTREEDVAQGGWDSALGATHCTRPAVLGCGAGGAKMPPVPRPRGRGRGVSHEAVTSPPPATLWASPLR